MFYIKCKSIEDRTAFINYMKENEILCVLLFIGGMQMLMLGLIGEYLGRIYICLNRAPQYVIRNTVNIDEK